MADRIITELIVQGAQQFVNDFSKAGQAVSGLAVVTETTGVRQRAAYDAIGKAAEEAAKRVEVAAKRQEEALKNIEPNIISRGTTPRLQRFQQAAQPPPQVIQPIPSTAIAGAQQLAGTLGQITAAANEVAVAETRKTKAIHDESAAHSKAGSTGITYLSTLSAIHAASFLLSNRTFTLIGSLFTLGAAFSKLGAGASILGATFGGALLFLNGLLDGMARVQQVAVSAATGLATFAAGVVAALGAAGVAGVRLAADVESQLALIKAIEQPTTEALRAISNAITQVALDFGVASVKVAEGLSLFARAGGGLGEFGEKALEVAEAIVKLTVASAGELQAADAARTLATAFKTFGPAGVTVAQAADIVTGAAQKSALTFTELNQAFQQSIPSAKVFGVSLIDLATVLASLGEQLRGTVAGTSFKQFLSDLVNPAKEGAEELVKLRVSIRDLGNNARPIFDIIDDLNKGLDKLSDADRAQSLNKIFESRAGLAGGILSGKTKEGLEALRATLEGITASNVVDVLLLPLNKQLEKLGVTVQEAGRAFGGPFLEPIRSATVQAITFIRGLIPVAQLAGQIIGTVLANQGFGQLRDRIVEVAGETKFAHFLIELANSLRNIADVIRGPVLTGIQQFVSILTGAAEAGTTVEGISKSFDSLNKAVQFAGALFQVVAKRLAVFIVEFVSGTGEGGKFRTAVTNLATAIATNLITSLVSAVFFMSLAVKTMEAFGSTIRTVTGPLKGFADAFIAVGEVFEGIAKTIRGASVETVRAVLTAAETLQGNIGPGVAPHVQKQVEGIFGAFDEFDKLRGTHPTLTALRAIAEGIVTVGDAAEKVDFDKIRQEAEKSTRATLQTFHDLAGEIPNELSNLRAEAEEELRKLTEILNKTTGAPAAGGDDKEVKRAQDRLIEAARDFNRRLQALNEETATRAQEIGDRATERIGDIFQKASQQLDRLARDTAERIQDLNDAFTQRRTERDFLETFQKSIDARLRAFQKNVDREELIESRALDRIRTARQRANEDTAKGFDLVEQSAERAFGRAQQDAERAFGAVQRASDKAFEAQQSAQEKALSAQLDAQAQLRTNARELSEAKPADRGAILQRQQLAAQDRAFQQGQAAQLDALRARQQASQAARQQQQEQAQVGFRRQQEESQLQFRLAAERRALAFRRSAEDAERIVREQEEDRSLVVREGREERLRVFREANEVAVARVRDKFELDAHNKAIERIRREASERQDDIETERDRQVNEVVDTANIQLNERANQLIKSLADIDRALEDVLENIPANIRSQVAPEIARLQAIVAQGRIAALTEFETAREKALALIETARILGESKLGGALGATTLGATQLTPQNIQQPMTNAFVQGLRIARDQGLVLGQQITVNVQSTQESVDFIEGIR